MFPRFLIAIVLATITAVLWLLYGFSADYHLFGWTMLPRVLHVLALSATAILGVFAGTQLILRVVLAELLEIEPSGLLRALIVSVLVFAAAASVLGHFSVDLSALLTTSAILSVFIGLATRPTLGSLIAGSTLGMDRVLRVGDGLMQGGQPVEILALNWRSVTGRRLDGSLVLLPNAAIAESVMEVLPHDRPLRVESVISIPAAVAPQRVAALVDEVLGDIAQIDFAQPVSIAPASFDLGSGNLRYAVRYWVVHYASRSAAESTLLCRLWYALQRAGVTISPTLADELHRSLDGPVGQAIATALRREPDAPWHAALAALADAPRAPGDMLLYAPGERIVLPERHAHCVFLLVDGALTESGADLHLPDATPAAPEAAADSMHSSRRAALQRITEQLARHIGPYAEHVVMTEASRTAGLAAICTAVASEIEDDEARETFLRAVSREEPEIRESGLIFHAARDATGSLVSTPPMRAFGPATVLAFSPDASQAAAAAGDAPSEPSGSPAPLSWDGWRPKTARAQGAIQSSPT